MSEERKIILVGDSTIRWVHPHVLHGRLPDNYPQSGGCGETGEQFAEPDEFVAVERLAP